MQDKRKNADRRSNNDRRSGGASVYNGPERRSQRFRRNEVRRKTIKDSEK